MRSGTITLISGADERVKSGMYFNVLQRNQIIRKWKKQYGKAWFKCALHICPDAGDGVNANGMNVRVDKPVDVEPPKHNQDFRKQFTKYDNVQYVY
jgi:hypothetical protein